MRNLKKNTLGEEINYWEKETISDGSTVLIDHLLIMYERGRLNINPKYQREYRRNKNQKTKFIESLLLGIPIPSIFVAQDNKTGNWEVIDGLQRISTLLEFFGYFKENELKNIPKEYQIISGLEKGEYLKKLKGITYKNLDEKYLNRIKDTNIYVGKLLNIGDTRSKYELFQRVNSGGSQLSPQELRNCVLVDKEETFYDFLYEKKQKTFFHEPVKIIKEKKIEEKHDIELILRYMILKNFNLTNKNNIKELIDLFIYYITGIDKNIEIFKGFKLDIEKESNIFDQTFKLIYNLLGKEAFYNRNEDGTVYKREFKYPWFDIITSGIGYNIEEKNIQNISSENTQNKVKNLILYLPSNYEYKEGIKTGRRSEDKLKFASRFGKEYFNIRT